MLARKQSMIKSRNIQIAAKLLMGAGLIVAGTGHLTFARKAFQAQVPDWVPLQKDDTVVYSGLVEIALGSALLLAPKRYETLVGKIAAGLFIAVFPGNISQFAHKRSAFGLNTDTKRFLRLFFQPVLVYWALKSTDQ